MSHPFGKGANSLVLNETAATQAVTDPHVIGTPLSHLVRSMDAENGKSGCQNRDDALNQCQARPGDLCIIIDNEA